MLSNYIKIAGRRLLKDKLYSFLNILGLALGISTCLIIYLVSSFELGFDRFHPDHDRIFRAVSQRVYPGAADKFYLSNISLGAAHAIRDEFPGVEKIANFYSYNVSVTVPAERDHSRRPPVKYAQGDDYNMIITDPAYFSIFRYQWLAGSPATAMTEPFKVVLTASKASQYFGALPFDQIVGKKLIYDDSLPLTVSGIVQDWNLRSDLHFTDFISFSTVGTSFLKYHTGFDDPTQPDSWGERTYAQTYILLKKDVKPAAFDHYATAMLKSRVPAKELSPGQQLQIGLQPLSMLHFDARYDDFYSRHAHLPTLYVLMGIAAFILVIAIINFINLSVSQSFARAREIGTRKVLGSGRAGIVFQFLTETAILVTFALLLSPIVVGWLLHAFPQFIPPGLKAEQLLTPATFAFVAAAGVITLLLAGLYPAFVMSGFSPTRSLKGSAPTADNKRQWLRQSLIVFQFSLSLFFIIATLVVGRQLHFMLHKDLGFDQEGIVNIDLRHINPNLNYTDNDNTVLANKVRRMFGVRAVSLNLFSVAQKGQRSLGITNPENGLDLALPARMGDENYVPLYGLKLIAGRNLRVQKADTATEYLLSEMAAKELGFRRPEDAIGHTLSSIRCSGPVVGILADFYSQSLLDPIQPVYIMAKIPAWGTWLLSVKMTAAGNPDRPYQSTLNAIQKDFKEIYPTESFNYSFFKDDIAQFYDEERRTSTIINAAMFISLFISCMGLFGLAAFTAGQRTKEIGIRKVLGATVHGIVLLLAQQFLRLVFLAFLIASPIAWYFMHKWLLDYANRISIGWWVFAASGSAAMIVALLTVGFHAMKAATANPIKALRTE